VIKICVDCKPYGYTADEMRLFVSEAAKAGLKVAGHVQTKAGAMRAIEAGIWSIEHSGALDDEAHKAMAKKAMWRVGTETPMTEYHTGTNDRAKAAFQRTVDGMKNARANGVKMAFSTDADYYIPNMTRAQVVLDFLKSWKAAEFPAPEILKIMTTNGYAVCDIADKRGPIKTGLPADLIAMRANPLQDVDALRGVNFVMKDGWFLKRTASWPLKSSSTAARRRRIRGEFTSGDLKTRFFANDVTGMCRSSNSVPQTTGVVWALTRRAGNVS
jgi:imidazolonepropionase-like amidohydrolase